MLNSEVNSQGNKGSPLGLTTHGDDNEVDDCQFAERPNIHGKAMLVALARTISLPDDKQRKIYIYREKKDKEMDLCQMMNNGKYI